MRKISNTDLIPKLNVSMEMNPDLRFFIEFDSIVCKLEDWIYGFVPLTSVVVERSFSMMKTVRCCKPSTLTWIFKVSRKQHRQKTNQQLSKFIVKHKIWNYWFLKQIFSISIIIYNYLNSFFVFNISLKFHMTLKF